MINRLHSLLYRPERGWDPVAVEHARVYAEAEWLNVDAALVDWLERRLGGFLRRRVLDLGAGPGQYSVAFARRGAIVTWHDVSRTYLAIARQRAVEVGAELEFSLGYLEDARRFVRRPFDLVFVRLSWSYCMGDRTFAALVYSLIRPGGAGYIDNNIEAFEIVRGWRRLTYALNGRLGWKIGHPHPPRGRIASLFQRYPMTCVTLDYSSPVNDKIFFVKASVLPA